MARRRKRRSSGWTWRLAGLALCAFFGLGYLSGLRAPQSAFERTLHAVNQYRSIIAEHAALVRRLPLSRLSIPPPADRVEARPPAGAVAIVERRDGFYTLSESGELRGPVSANAEDNLPIISGSLLDRARANDLVDYASVLIRAEAELSELISEMRLDNDGGVSLFMDRWRIEVVLDLDQAPLELARAASILRRWRGREREIVSLDMTTPGEAVMRLRAEALAKSAKGGAITAARAANRRDWSSAARSDLERVASKAWAGSVMEAGAR